MTHQIKFIKALFISAMICACTNSENIESDTSNAKESNEITVQGVAQSVAFGKDGYTASLLTSEGRIYNALVSIVNLGGPDNYVTIKVGDDATVKGENDYRGGQNYLKVTKVINVVSPSTEPVIYSKAFGGIIPGRPISMYTDQLKQEELKTAEGKLTIYRFTQEETSAYCLVDPKDKTLVGDIYITSAPASTEQGIKVGSTFGALKTKYPDIEVHGSEIEGRTYANKNNLSYRLDIPNFTYKVDINKIPADTKITEIIINR